MGDTWQPYSDALTATGTMNSASIIGLADCSYWAYSGDHVPQPEEAQQIINALNDPDIARANGIRIAGNKYFVTRAEPGLIMAKLGNGGAIIMQSVQAFTLGVFGGDDQPAFGCLKEIQQMVEGFKELQY